MPSSAPKLFGSETGQQFHLTLAGNTKIAEDGLDRPLIMVKVDVLVCSRSQRDCSTYIFLKPMPEKILHVEQMPHILLNRPFPLMPSVGWMYLKCLGVKCDSHQATEWFRKSAEQGCPIGQINLASLFEEGKGVALDYPEAHQWYRLAAEQGYQEAERAMKTLVGIMTPKQLHESEVRASAWKSKTPKSSTGAVESQMED